jgi:phospho-N-acetylmuramoyl-pentapeptide-transferase
MTVALEEESRPAPRRVARRDDASQEQTVIYLDNFGLSDRSIGEQSRNEVMGVLDLVVEKFSPPAHQAVRICCVKGDLNAPVHGGTVTTSWLSRLCQGRVVRHFTLTTVRLRDYGLSDMVPSGREFRLRNRRTSRRGSSGGTRTAGEERPRLKTILVTGGASLLLALFGTPVAIRLLRRLGYGQPIRVEGLKSHETKRGTPTMGGVVMVLAALVGYLIGHIATDVSMTASGLLVLFLMVGLGLVGFIDDFIKIFQQTSVGLRSGAKLAGQVVVGTVFAIEVLRHPDGYGLTPADPHLSFLRDFGPAIGTLPFVIWIVIVIAGTSNAVNIADGLDGLATGATILVLAAYVLIGIWQERNDCTNFLAKQCYQIRDPLDLAVVAAAVLGACFGFLWWNAPPAKIIMGDTGSLALGGVLAGLAVCTKTQLLLGLLGGLFAIITLSTIIQVSVFKITRSRTGRGIRVFKMTPLHHHFELMGWADTTIVIRFWLISGLCVALGLGLFYAQWLQT